MIAIPIRLGRGQNDRGHPLTRHRKAKAEREAVQWKLNGHPKPALPCVVRITRISPSAIPLDDDNLVGSQKHVRDQVAAWLGVDDGRKDIVRYEPQQERGPWGVRIEFEPMVREDTGAGDRGIREACGA